MKTQWTASPCERVLSDAALLQHITGFQAGVPVALLEFWAAHQHAHNLYARRFFFNSYALVELLVRHGSPRLLDLAQRAQYYDPDDPLDVMVCHTVKLDAVVPLALEHHRADLLRWGIHNLPSIDQPAQVWRNAIVAYRDGDVGILDVLQTDLAVDAAVWERMLWVERLADLIRDARLLRWLMAALPKGTIDRRMVDVAATAGNLEMLQCLRENGIIGGCSAVVLERVYERHDLDVFAFVLEHFVEQVNAPLARAMIHSEDATVWQLISQFRGLFVRALPDIVLRLIADGALAKLQRLLDAGVFSVASPISLDDVTRHGHLDAIQLLHQHGVAAATTDAVDLAAEHEQWSTVKFLLENRPEGCTVRATDAAVQQGRFDSVKYLHEKFSVEFSVDSMDDAATCYTPAMIRYLHEHSHVGCTTQAMDCAAECGNFLVVRFLHGNRNEGCTTDAMDQAAANGHVDVVEYLHAERREGCTPAAVHQALKNGHLDVVAFLFRHYPHLFGPATLHDLLLYGAFEIYLTLRVQYPHEAAEVVEPALVAAAVGFELPTIRFIVAELGRTDVAYRAMDGAAANALTCGSVQWLCTVFSVAGPQSCRLSAVRAAVDAHRSWFPVDNIKLLVRLCCEPNAHSVAVAMANELHHAALAEELMTGNDEGDTLPAASALHPFLLDERTPAWAVRDVLQCADLDLSTDPFHRIQGTLSWAIRAVYKRELPLLEILRTIDRSTLAVHSCFSGEGATNYSFHGAREAAVRVGDMKLLQWLLENVDLPVEPGLLDQAVYYHQYNIALWLVGNCPKGCTTLDWQPLFYVPWHRVCGFDEGLLDWLECHDDVRGSLDAGSMAEYAVKMNDVVALGRLSATYPQLTTARSR